MSFLALAQHSWGLLECSGVNWTPNLGLESSPCTVYLLIKPAAAFTNMRRAQDIPPMSQPML